MIRLILLSTLLIPFLTACKDESVQQTQDQSSHIEESANLKIRQPDDESGFLFMDKPAPRTTLTGQYLSSQFAQNRRDWDLALNNLNYVTKNDPKNDDIMRMAMVLKAGSGSVASAIEDARILIDNDDAGSLSPLFVAVGLFHDKNYPALDNHLNTIPQNGLTTFVKPILMAWSDAARGKLNIRTLQSNTVHIKHSILIADYTKNTDQISNILQIYQKSPALTYTDQVFIADMYAYIGEADAASQLYSTLLGVVPNEQTLIEKRDALKNNKPIPNGYVSAKSPQNGLGRGLTDIALLLYQDSSEDSAKVFANLALYMDKTLSTPHILLAEIARQNEHYDKAITHLQNVPKTHEQYQAAQRSIAELYELDGDRSMAIQTYRSLADKNGDYQALIAIGDIYRGDKNFKDAIMVYNTAEKKLAGPDGVIPDVYWYLYYMRGMAHEQYSSWDKAEADLKKALSYRPNNPYVLNYLGYAWADQGMHLDRALEMIDKAVTLRPNDGYITDSLGWVYYKLGRYKEAIAPLERAVELMPYDTTVNDHLGDAYWRVGRKLEARFQWQRAKNNSEDDKLTEAINDKLKNGLPKATDTKQAQVKAP